MTSFFSKVVLGINLVLFPIFCCAQQKILEKTITSFGAKGDGKTINTMAINHAIEYCYNNGGGIVIVPKGVFLSGTINLKSNVDIKLDKNAEIRGVSRVDLYRPFIPSTDLTRYSTISDEGKNGNSAYDSIWTKVLILGNGVSNITIYGEGRINGDHVFNTKGEEGMRGPHTIILADCRNITVSNVTIEKAANYAILGYNLENATFQNVHIKEGWDGIHIRGGKNIVIRNCLLQTGDDAIAGGFWEHFVVSDCEINSSCNGIRVIMPVMDFSVTNCSFVGPGVFAHRTSGKLHRNNMLTGIYIQPGGWGAIKGDLNDIRITHVRMRNMGSPFLFELHKGNNATNIIAEDIVADSIKGPIALHSSNGGIYKNVIFKDIKVDFQTDAFTSEPWAFGANNVQYLVLQNVILNATGIKPLVAAKLENVVFPIFKNTNIYSLQNKENVKLINSGDIEP